MWIYFMNSEPQTRRSEPRAQEYCADDFTQITCADYGWPSDNISQIYQT